MRISKYEGQDQSLDRNGRGGGRYNMSLKATNPARQCNNVHRRVTRGWRRGGEEKASAGETLGPSRKRGGELAKTTPQGRPRRGGKGGAGES